MVGYFNFGEDETTLEDESTIEDDTTSSHQEFVEPPGLGLSYPSFVHRTKMEYCTKIGGFGDLEGHFNEPSGIAVTLDGDIAVADTNNHRIQVFNILGNFKFSFGKVGKHNGQLLFPNRVAINPINGDFVITERSPTHQVQVFDCHGNFIRRFGTSILQHPRGVCVDFEGNIIVVECKLMRVCIFSSVGKLLHKFTAVNHLLFPNNICVNSEKELLISDNRGHSVKIFDYNGNFLRSIGGVGITNYPISVSCNSKKQFLVADNHNKFNLTVFDENGYVLQAFESKVRHAQCFDAVMFDGYVAVASKDFKLYLYKLEPEKEVVVGHQGLLSQPPEILYEHLNPSVIYTDEVIYNPPVVHSMVDNCNFGEDATTTSHQEFVEPPGLGLSYPSFVHRTKMEYCAKIGGFGDLEGHFNEPSGIAVTLDGDIAVADTNNHRIQVFNILGNLKFSFGEVGKHNGQLLFPNRVAISPINGDFVITERSPTHQVQVFDCHGNFVRKFGTSILQHPRGVCVDSEGNIIVVECKLMRVCIFSSVGKLLHKFTAVNHLLFPNNICVNSEKELLISDNRGHSVKIFDYNGNFLRSIGGVGITNYPISVSCNSKNQYLVADNHNKFNLTVFDQNGNIVQAFESKVRHSQCFDAAIVDGYVAVASKDFKVYLYKLEPENDVVTPHPIISPPLKPCEELFESFVPALVDTEEIVFKPGDVILQSLVNYLKYDSDFACFSSVASAYTD